MQKGGEGESGYFRRNHLVQVPVANGLDDVNAQLLAACQKDEHRVIAGREQSIGTAILVQREHLLPLVAERFDLADRVSQRRTSPLRSRANHSLLSSDAAREHSGGPRYTRHSSSAACQS